MTYISMFTPQDSAPDINEIIEVDLRIRDDVGVTSLTGKLEYNEEELEFLLARNGNYFSNRVQGRTPYAVGNTVFIEMADFQMPLVRDAIVTRLYFVRRPNFRFKPPDYDNPEVLPERMTVTINLNDFLEVGQAPSDTDIVTLKIQEEEADGDWVNVFDTEIDDELMVDYLATGIIEIEIPDVQTNKELRIRVNIDDSNVDVGKNLEFRFREFQTRDLRGNLRSSEFGELTVSGS